MLNWLNHTCFVHGTFDGDGAQFGGWHCCQTPFERSHRSADSTDNDDLLTSHHASKFYICRDQLRDT